MSTPAKTLDFDLGRGLARVTNLRNLLNNSGERAWGLLRVGANVVDGQRVTIGADTFEVDIINTDAAVDTVGALADTLADTVLTIDGASTPTWVVGDLIRIENEICRIKQVHSSTRFTIQRGRCGTTKAAHADNTDVYESDTPGTIVAAGRIPLGLVTTLTPAVFTPALVDEINSDAGTDGNSAACTAISLNTGAQMLLTADAPGVVALATTETLAGAGNAWDAATMGGGVAASVRRMFAGTRVPIAAEVTQGAIYVPMDFTPTVVNIKVVTTATGVEVAWNGGYTIVAKSGNAPGYLIIDNSSTTDWADTDTLHIIAVE